LRNGALHDKSKADAFLKKIEENAERLDSLIHDILDLSKLEVTDSHLEFSSVDMNQMFQDLRDQFLWKLEEKKQTFEILNDVPILQADKQLLEQVFSNLVANAIRYCPEGAKILVKGKLTSVSNRPTALFEVIDNGLGIPEKDIPRIFERFYRADKSRNRAFGGTGLGLAIVKHIVLSHQGKVKAENLPTGGMRFSLWFPTDIEKRAD
jgi:two-component system phosphate regulon sensor histidine kinase PhoR